MTNTVLVSNKNANDLQELAENFAADPTAQAILLKGVFTREANLVSAQTSKQKAHTITQAVVDANRGNRTLERTGLTSKEDAYIDIAVGLKKITTQFAEAYTSKHNIGSYKTLYTPRTHTPQNQNTASWAPMGFLNTSAVFNGESLYISKPYCQENPESGDVLIVKALDSTDHGNERDDLSTFSYNSQKEKATSVGLSMIAF